MTTQAVIRQVKFFDVARAFAIFADHADRTLDLAVEVDDDTITVLESSVHGIARKMNGDPIAAQVEALLSRHPSVASPPLAPPKANGDKPHWKKIGERGASDTRWEDPDFHGMQLGIQKLGAGRYEGRINGKPLCSGKFKKSIRERVEKEAAKRVNA